MTELVRTALRNGDITALECWQTVLCHMGMRAGPLKACPGATIDDGGTAPGGLAALGLLLPCHAEIAARSDGARHGRELRDRFRGRGGARRGGRRRDRELRLPPRRCRASRGR